MSTSKRKGAPLPRVARLADNIRATYALATAYERRDGAEWYLAANAYADQLAREYDTTLQHAAGVIAVLSPRVPWSRNVTIARLAFDHGTDYALTANVGKAARIVAGEAPDDVVSGPKVSCFYANIVDPSGDEITIDRHAFDIAQGKRGTDKSRAPLQNRHHYARYCQAYQVVADELGLGACQLQAITWLTWRRIHGITA